MEIIDDSSGDGETEFLGGGRGEASEGNYSHRRLGKIILGKSGGNEMI